MERFKLNDKEYFIEINNANECVIKEFGNKDFEIAMSKEELEELEILFEAPYVITKSGLANDYIREIIFRDMDNKAVCFLVKLNGLASDSKHLPLIQVPLVDFCKDVVNEYYTATAPKISDKMESFSKAFAKWRKEAPICFAEGTCILTDMSAEPVGIGHFEENKLVAISKCNLSMFDRVSLVVNNNAFKAKLIYEEQLTDFSYRYKLVIEESALIELSHVIKDAAETFDTKDTSMHEKICNFFKFREAGKAKSHLDNFFDI